MGKRFKGISQGKIVVAIDMIMLALFAVALNGFATVDNLLSLLQNVSVLGILGLGMAITVIGRGIDLSMIAIAVMPVAWSFVEMSNGTPAHIAILYAVIFAMVIGFINGWLIAYVEVPAIFATLASGIVVFGIIQYFAVSSDLISIPDQMGVAADLIRGTTFNIPNSVIAFLIIAALVSFFLKARVSGRFVYAIGDNPMAARVAGLPVRPNIVLQYVLSALIALLAGFFLATTVDGANTRLFNSTMIYDVILIVVLGGIGLSGGKGAVSNVLAGTILIGILTNAMTIMNVGYYTQNLVKALILLLTITADSILNPRDEQTSQQGDI